MSISSTTISPQPVFCLAEDDGDREGRISPFPWSEVDDIPLPHGYEPTKFDIINGRGRKSYNHVANRRFRELIAMHLSRYQAARCKVDKTMVVVGIVASIRSATPPGAFIKKDAKQDRWISLSDEAAREKVGHCLRDMIASKRNENEKNQEGAPNGCTATTSIKHKGTKPRMSDHSYNHVSMEAYHHAVHKANHFRGRNGKISPTMSIGGSHPLVGSDDDDQEQTATNMKQNMNLAIWGASPPHHHTGEMHGHPGMMPPPTGVMPVRMPYPGYPSYHPMMMMMMMPTPYGMMPRYMPFNSAESVSLQKGNLQLMSHQQRNILGKLEGGFKGSVERLIEAAATTDADKAPEDDVTEKRKEVDNTEDDNSADKRDSVGV